MNGQERTIGTTTLRVVQDDITTLAVDAIVNAANPQLRHGGGVAAAISRAGGPVIQAESDAWVRDQGVLDDGVAAVTSAGEMPATWVIHTAGPVFDPTRDDNEVRLRSAVRAALEAAAQRAARTVAFPAISAGIYGYPPDDATRVLVDEVATVVRDRPEAFDGIWMVAFDDAMATRFRTALATSA